MQDNGRQKVRETLWFKKGAQDAAIAQQAIDALEPDAVDSLPIEDRYLDDGSVRPADSATYGIHTGKTEYLVPVLATVEAGGTTLNTKALIGDLKRGRTPVLAAIGASVFAILAVVGVYLF